MAGIREIARFDRLDMGARVEVDTSGMPVLNVVVAKIRTAFESL